MKLPQGSNLFLLWNVNLVIMNNNYRYTVATRCFTYNQAQYIEGSLRGFAMQDTDFPVVYIIVDDASTDGEPEVIQSWANNNLLVEDGTQLIREMPYGQLIEGTLKGKPLSTFVMLLLSENYYQTGREIKKFEYISHWFGDAKYHALCEGDDYWIHPQKLALQVSFMESNPDYGMCHTDFSLSDGSRRRHYEEKYPDGNYFPGLLEHENVMIGTLTVLYRKAVYDRTPKYYFNEDFVAGDKAIWIELSREAKIKYLPEVTACYRILEKSASHSPSLEKNLAFIRGLQDIREFYAKKFNITLTDYDNYYTSALRACYIASNAQVAEKYYQEAKAKKSVTKRGLIFYWGAKSKLFHSLIELFIKPK